MKAQPEAQSRPVFVNEWDTRPITPIVNLPSPPKVKVRKGSWCPEGYEWIEKMFEELQLAHSSVEGSNIFTHYCYMCERHYKSCMFLGITQRVANLNDIVEYECHWCRVAEDDPPHKFEVYRHLRCNTRGKTCDPPTLKASHTVSMTRQQSFHHSAIRQPRFPDQLPNLSRQLEMNYRRDENYLQITQTVQTVVSRGNSPVPRGNADLVDGELQTGR